MGLILVAIGVALLVVWASYEVRELEKTVKYSEELQEIFKKGIDHE